MTGSFQFLQAVMVSRARRAAKGRLTVTIFMARPGSGFSVAGHIPVPWAHLSV